ncbi:MAG TPA: SDR family oxidoreductase [Cyclobacteriaceae bacterium]|nr:SDR family oxidoreductase [Cyclobacteriaceae bacterium]
MFDYQDKTVIVTGGGSGIGQSIARSFASNNARIYILDLNEEGSMQTVEAIVSDKGWAKALPCNVADQSNVKATIDSIARESGKIDVLINNAGIAHIGTLETTSEADFDRVFQVNVKGVYNVMHEVIGHMKKQGGGVILNMASIAATSGIPDRFAYSMSKGAVLTMTLSVARDFLSDNIRCNSISPARVHTPFVDGFLRKNYPGQEAAMFDKLSKAQPIGRMGKPEEIASLALYLCSKEASFITGCDYLIDGGFTALR